MWEPAEFFRSINLLKTGSIVLKSLQVSKGPVKLVRWTKFYAQLSFIWEFLNTSVIFFVEPDNLNFFLLKKKEKALFREDLSECALNCLYQEVEHIGTKQSRGVYWTQSL